MKCHRLITSMTFVLALTLGAGAALAQDHMAHSSPTNANRLTPQQREQVRQIRQQQRAETQQKLAQVLTPEQMAAWEAKKAEHRHDRHEGHKREHSRQMPSHIGSVMSPPIAADRPDRP